MGVKSLMHYACNSRLEDLRLKDTTVVVDLLNFLYGTLDNKITLTNSPSVSLSHGGCYRVYRYYLNELFGIFQSCNVHCIFVLDGSSNSDKKNENFSRYLRRIKDLKRISHNQLKPILITNTFIEAALHFKHQIYCHNDEGDFITGRLALHFNIPAIANDSDYYCFYYEKNCGYIPFSTMRYQRNEREMKENFITCKIFKSDKSGNSPFGFSMKLHWAIPILCKNDYESTKKCLLTFDSKRFCKTMNVKDGPSTIGMIKAVHRWLTNVQRSNETILYDLNSSKEIIKREMRKVLANSIHKYIEEFVDEVFNRYTCQDVENWEKLIRLISDKNNLIIDPEAHNTSMVRSPYFHLDKLIRQIDEQTTQFVSFESIDLPDASILSKSLRLTLFQLTAIELRLKEKVSMNNESCELKFNWLQRIRKQETEIVEYKINITQEDISRVNNLLSSSRDSRKEKFLYYLLRRNEEIDLNHQKINEISKKYSCWFLMFLISLGIWRRLTSSPSKDKLTRTLLISVIYFQISDRRIKSIYRNRKMEKLPKLLWKQVMDFIGEYSRYNFKLTNVFMSTIIHPIREWEYIFGVVGSIHNFFYNPFANAQDGIVLSSPFQIFNSRQIFNIMSNTTVDHIKEMSNIINEIYDDLP
ncbi:hypothetical protein SNEBB_000309 [Seison nebaliae]|nr:hypothetical protein SNEBB_000309 [Seison nebaliae]